MAYWLMKSEPDVYGWDTLVKDKVAPWTDVRNYQARNNMMAMKKGDQVFFYHSNIGREIVGIMEVVKEHYPDPKDERFVLVDVKPVKKLANPVTLADIKANKSLQEIALIRQSRLSVMPITAAEWKTVLALAA
jgi:predicted RNA-binding protein with PUA-like domain